MGEFFGKIDGAEIREGLVAPAHGEQCAAFGLFVDGDLFGFLEAESDGAFEDGVCFVTDLFGFFGEGCAVVEPGFSSEGCVLEIEFGGGVFFDFLEYFNGLCSDFGADSVAFEDGDNFSVGHRGSLVCSCG